MGAFGPDSVKAELLYLAGLRGTSIKDANGWPGRSLRRMVTIMNGRRGGPFWLDRHGFAFMPSKSGVADFYDHNDIRQRYYPELQLMLRAVTGAVKVTVFAHDVRSSDPLRQAGKVREPVAPVHNDYTPNSAPQMVREVLGSAEAEQWLERRFAEINVWRPIKGPVYAWPLAVCDAESIGARDLVAVDEGLRHEVFMMRFNPAHRWYYFPRMKTDEIILIKGFDSRESGYARYAPHAAFADPAAPPGAPSRESIEARALLLF